MLAALLWLGAWVAAADEHTLSVRCELEAIELGTPFELSFERRADLRLELLPFEPRAPEGLVLELLDSARSPGAETLRYRARAFALGSLRLEGFQSWARDSANAARSAATASALELTIQPALPPGPVGKPELPGPPVRPGDSTHTNALLWLLPLLALGALAAFGVTRRQRTLPAQEPDLAPALQTARQRLLALEVLAQDAAASRAELMTELVQLARALLDSQHALPAPARTTPEMHALLHGIGEEASRAYGFEPDELLALLRAGDACGYARGAPSALELNTAFVTTRALCGLAREGGGQA